MSTASPPREMSRQLRDLVKPGHYIDGIWNENGDSQLDVLDPATEAVIASLPLGRPADIDAAVAAARKAFDSGPWPRMSPRERSAILARLAERIGAEVEPLAELGVFEIGSPITLSRGLHAGVPVQFFEYWSDMALKGPNGPLLRGPADPGGPGDGGQPPLPGASRRSGFGDRLQLSADADRLQGGRCAGCRLHGRVDAVAAGTAVLDRVRGGSARRRGSRPASSTS